MRKFMILGTVVALVVAALALPALAQQDGCHFRSDQLLTGLKKAREGGKQYEEVHDLGYGGGAGGSRPGPPRPRPAGRFPLRRGPTGILRGPVERLRGPLRGQ